MGFLEATKLKVKQKADFTCCWCRDRRNKVEIHHIKPESEEGPDIEDNAAPLCGSCHDLYGGNPDLRKEIRLRRDQWYKVCRKLLNPEYGWPIGLDVPLLSFYREIDPTSSITTKGIQFTDNDPTKVNAPPLLYLSVFFKRSRYFGQRIPSENEKWLYLEANMRFAFSLKIQVRAWNDRDISELMWFLTGDANKYGPEFLSRIDTDLQRQYLLDRDKGWNLNGPRSELDKNASGDYLRIWRESEENRLTISTFTLSKASISIHARISDEMTKALAKYLEESGFTEPFGK